MFCYKCGAQNPDDSNFCGSCGTQLHTDSPKPTGQIKTEKSAISQVKFDTSTIICIALSVAMILVMILLPMFEWQYGYRETGGKFYHSGSAIFSLVGENNVRYSDVDEDLVKIFSNTIFIFNLATIVAANIFKIMKKKLPGFLSSCAILGVFSIYNLFFVFQWTLVTTYRNPNRLFPGAGNIIYTCFAIALFVLFLRDLKNKKNSKKQS